MKSSEEAAARVTLGFYNALLVVFGAVLLLKKAVKFGRRGHAHEWDLARWNAPQSWEKSTSRVVLVALSWGEVGILAEVSRRLLSGFPKLEIVWSIRDKAAQQLAQKQFPAQKIVPMSFDFAVPARAWVQSVAPDVLIVVEKFWWPNLIWRAKMRGAKIVLLNGRSRGRDKTRYRLMSGFQRWVLSAFDLLMFESESQIERLRAVLPRGARVLATGNVKFAFEAPAPPAGAAQLEMWLQDRARNESGPLPLLIAGSTSPVDEAWAIDAFEVVRREIPCALLLAPRRTTRADDVEKAIAARGLKVSRRSSAEKVGNANADVLLLDTLGELFYAYAFGMAAYVGGAIEGRGHNIIEPLAHGIGVGYGPNRGDFEGAQRAAEEAGVGFRLYTPQELAPFWQKALGDASWRDEMRERARSLLQAQQGSLQATLDALEPVLRTL